MAIPSKSLSTLAILAIIASYIYVPIIRRMLVLGVNRVPSNTVFTNEKDEFAVIEDTVHCEDLHHHLPSNSLFTACEDDADTRFGWFPPLGIFERAPVGGAGSFHVIDVETKKSTRLAFSNFVGSFVTHGIDVLTDPSNSNAVFIFAVNHLPNPSAGQAGSPKARSQIELFHHLLGSKSVQHIRSIRHPLVRTPNDIYAMSPTEFYVTNDHHYRDGIGRQFEEVFPAATWSSTIHVSLSSLEAIKDAESGVSATVALKELHNNNGLGHGPNGEMLIGGASSGILYRAFPKSSSSGNAGIRVEEVIPIDSAIDNPSYYEDAFAHIGDDASGYVVAGLSRGIDLAHTCHDRAGRDPVMVWLVQRSANGADWKKRLLFEDDGSRIRTASAAVLVGIDPRLGGGAKKGWLFVTGFLSENIVAVKVDL